MSTATPRRGRRRRTLLSLMVLLVCAVGLVLGGAGSALAHARLKSVTPGQDTVLKAVPKEVALTFTEAVTVSDRAIRVFAPDGRRVDTGKVGRVGGDGATVRVSLPAGLPDGTFTVSWKAVSADSHPVSGAFVFSIGKPSGSKAVLPNESPGGGAAGMLFGAARFAAYTGYALVIGAAAFVLVCRPRGVGLRPLGRLLAVSWSALLLSALAQLVLRAPYESGEGLGQAVELAALRHTLATDPGVALWVRLVLVAVTAALWGPLTQPAGEPLSPKRRIGLIAAASSLAIVLAGTWALAEHPSAGPQVIVAVPMAVVHLVAMAVWLGGLAALLVTLFREPEGEGVEAAVVRFSRLAFCAVTVLVATGVYQSWREVGSWDALVSTPYGRLLLVKVGGVVGMLVAAWFSRRWVTRLRGGAVAEVPSPEEERATAAANGAGSTAVLIRRRVAALAARADGRGGGDGGCRDLRRSVCAEAAVAVLVLAVTTVLTGTSPGRGDAPARTAANSSAVPKGPGVASVSIPFDTGASGGLGKGKVQIDLEPGTTGTNSLNAVAFGPDGGIASVTELKVELSLPGRGLGPLPVKVRNVGGYWAAEDFRIPMAGDWKVSVTVRTGDISEDTGSRTVRIG
ncbi:copper resistance CopC/CopD family protein [Wenjunlia tyrosinilytica]|uniref:Transport integral membrane protein n=1 Tax=Wenjunlia tyrosinilytica TaxID=1544741 RepID=A0A917ZUC6_9ACTN|nr:copper resistance protein CopC [Wenjunlia tyrosinilytica]GGO95688.1 transport integral membrane protein [Wenjunlia tyrosinilytica]